MTGQNEQNEKADRAIEVRLVQLPPQPVAAALGFGQEPELQAIDRLLRWARAQGLPVEPQPGRFFGFNNPNPSPGSPNYGYELWMAVESQVQGGEEIEIKQSPGGDYAVTHCQGVWNLMQTWRELVQWVEASPYEIDDRPCLEEHLSAWDTPLEALEFNLYLPVLALR